MNHSNILALDLGDKHVGVALYKPSMGVKPLEAISFRDQFVLKRKLIDLVKEYEVKTVVVGDMGRAKLTSNWAQFIQALEKELTIKVEMVGERLTSFQAGSDAVQSGVKTRDPQVHSQAAIHILNEYLTKIE
jgi:putative transcription antitermination factor YqgF